MCVRRDEALRGACYSRRLFRCDRLVLLGDVLELRQGPVREALSVAEPVLRELGAALGPGARSVVVAGQPRPPRCSTA